MYMSKNNSKYHAGTLIEGAIIFLLGGGRLFAGEPEIFGIVKGVTFFFNGSKAWARIFLCDQNFSRLQPK